MQTRYLDGIKKNKLNFVVRKYPIYFFGLFFLIASLSIFSIIILISFFNYYEKSLFEENCYIGLILLISILIFYISRKLQLITISAEFQSMLFSNSIKSLTEFYLIINTDGEIVYSDERDIKLRGFLDDFFSNKFQETLLKVKEGFYYHKFYIKGYKIEVKTLIRPSDYLLVSINSIESSQYYNDLLDANNIPTYKIENDKLIENNQSYKKYFPIDDLKINYKSTSIISNVEGYPTFFNNYYTQIDNAYYGILIPTVFQLNQLLNNIPFGVAIFNNDLEIIDTNKLFYEFTEVTDNINFKLNKKINIKNEKKSFILDLEFKNNNYIRSYIINFNDIFIGFFIDLNELKSLKEKFHHSQKIESLGQLSGGIAHDFNNILTAISGFSEVLLSDMDINNKYYYDIVHINSSAEMGQTLVKKILAFARNQTLKIEIFNINEVIMSIKQIIERLIPENIIFLFDLTPNLKLVKADKIELEQTIINLVVNARDAISSTGEILIKTENILIEQKESILKDSQNEEVISKGEYVKISLSDNGKGIDKKTLPKIFDPFFSTKEVNKGTGLGLSTAYGIIKQIGGYIDVESTLNKGSKFSLFIPVCYEAIPQSNAKSQKTETINENILKNKKILLVEDDKMVRQFLIKALEKQNLQFIDSSSPSAALDVFNSNKSSISIVITDVIMPEMSGPEMVDLMRKHNKDLKVIFISGYTRDKLKFNEDDKNSYFLEKPFKIQDLIILINKIFI